MADTNPPYYEWENFKLKATTLEEFISALDSFGISTDAQLETVDLTVNYPTAQGTKTTTQKGFKATTSGAIILPAKWTNPHVKKFKGLKLYEVSNNTSTYKLVTSSSNPSTTGTSVTFQVNEDGDGQGEINYTLPAGEHFISIEVNSGGGFFDSYGATYNRATNKIYFYGSVGSSSSTSVTETIIYTITTARFFIKDKTYLLAGAELVTTHNGYFTTGTSTTAATDFLTNTEVYLTSKNLDTQTEVKVIRQFSDQFANYSIPKFGVNKRLLTGAGNYATTSVQTDNQYKFFSYKNSTKPALMTITNPSKWGFFGNCLYNEMTDLGQNWTKDLGVWLDNKHRLHINSEGVDIINVSLPPTKNVYLCVCSAWLKALSSCDHSFLGVHNWNESGSDSYYNKGAVYDKYYGPAIYQKNTGNKKAILTIQNDVVRNWTRTYQLSDSSYTVWQIQPTSTWTYWPRSYSYDKTPAIPDSAKKVTRNYWKESKTLSSNLSYQAASKQNYYDNDYVRCQWGEFKWFNDVEISSQLSNKLMQPINLSFQIQNLKTINNIPISWTPSFNFPEYPTIQLQWLTQNYQSYVRHTGTYNGLLLLPGYRSDDYNYYDTTIMKGHYRQWYSTSDTYDVDIHISHSNFSYTDVPCIYGIIIDD